MTSLNNPVKLPLDANGNVLANINAQNITPNAKATNVSVDANGNVLANVNAQNINPNVNNVAGSVAGSVGSVTGAVGSITNPPLRHKFMTNLITTTTSTTNVTLGTYVSSNGIGIVSVNYNSGGGQAYLSLYNGTTNLGSINTGITAALYTYGSFAYAPQGAVTLSLEGYQGTSGDTAYYDVTVYEAF
jgi:hypothetical protein